MLMYTETLQYMQYIYWCLPCHAIMNSLWSSMHSNRTCSYKRKTQNQAFSLWEKQPVEQTSWQWVVGGGRVHNAVRGIQHRQAYVSNLKLLFFFFVILAYPVRLGNSFNFTSTHTQEWPYLGGRAHVHDCLYAWWDFDHSHYFDNDFPNKISYRFCTLKQGYF